MQRTNLFAYTALTPYYPEFISVNMEENGNVSITVRSAAKEDGSCGNTVSIELDKRQALELSSSLLNAS